MSQQCIHQAWYMNTTLPKRACTVAVVQQSSKRPARRVLRACLPITTSSQSQYHSCNAPRRIVPTLPGPDELGLHLPCAVLLKTPASAGFDALYSQSEDVARVEEVICDA